MRLSPFKLFLDSNVIISGIFSDMGSPRLILDVLCLGLPFIEGVTGRYNLIEIERNLKRKMPETIPVYERYLPLLNLAVVPLPSMEEIEKYRGALSDKDVPVLASAVKSHADFLVTGDKKHFSALKDCESLALKVVSPSECLVLLAHFFKELG